MKIALLSEKKLPADSRVALSPEQAKQLMMVHPNLTIVAESSNDRIFSDEDYRNADVQVVGSVEDCDILLGIKEVPVKDLIPEKTYLFFSHTIKMQAYNQKLMQAFLEKKITMVDYECLEWGKGGRVLGFGRWAGIVGAYNGLLTWGKKHNSFDLKPAYLCKNYDELKSELKKVSLPNIKITLTGTGRVASGSLEVMDIVGIKAVTPEELLNNSFEKPVYSQLLNRHIFKRKNYNGPWNRPHFFEFHDEYIGQFDPYLSKTDLLINGFYWEEDLPALFTKKQTADPDFNIKVIADITCDVEGSVPITFKATSIEDPTFGWDPLNQVVTAPFLPNTIDVMAVTNLPTEMPASASEDFGDAMSTHILPLFVGGDPDQIIKRATLTHNGQLTPDFNYLQDYADGLES
jgi:saccharopine dehydrogenase (NAD+, L-lysine forming)